MVYRAAQEIHKIKAKIENIKAQIMTNSRNGTQNSFKMHQMIMVTLNYTKTPARCRSSGALISSVGVRFSLTWEVRGGATLGDRKAKRGRVECLRNKMDGESSFINSIHIKIFVFFVLIFSTLARQRIRKPQKKKIKV